MKVEYTYNNPHIIIVELELMVQELALLDNVKHVKIQQLFIILINLVIQLLLYVKKISIVMIIIVL